MIDPRDTGQQIQLLSDTVAHLTLEAVHYVAEAARAEERHHADPEEIRGAERTIALVRQESDAVSELVAQNPPLPDDITQGMLRVSSELMLLERDLSYALERMKSVA